MSNKMTNNDETQTTISHDNLLQLICPLRYSYEGVLVAYHQSNEGYYNKSAVVELRNLKKLLNSMEEL